MAWGTKKLQTVRTVLNGLYAYPITIGDNRVIGAGSVATRNIPRNSLAVGNPCRVIKTLETES